VVEGVSSDIGFLVLRVGDEMPNHVHYRCDESFVVIEGEASLWIDGARRYALSVGDVYRCCPGEMHYFVNDSDGLFRMVFIKSPASPGDTVTLPWRPGEPVPVVPPARVVQ
jgi:mannose-6-phosphate isomerase-like protein (cupin superfamily)